jgi:hypothetical protein
MKEKLVAAAKPAPINRMQLDDHDRSLVDTAICGMLSLEDNQELHALRKRIARAGHQLRVFVHHDYYRRVGTELVNEHVAAGALLHAKLTHGRASSVPTIFFEEEQKAEALRKQMENYSGVYVVPTLAGWGDISEEIVTRTTSEFASTNKQSRDFCYRLLFDGLGVKRIVLGGMYTNRCLQQAEEAAHKLGIEIAWSRFALVNRHTNTRGEEVLPVPTARAKKPWWRKVIGQ